LFRNSFGFWECAFLVTLVSVLGWVVVSIVNKIGDVIVKSKEAKAASESDYLRQMLAEIEEIKRRLALKDR
jgi:hypothetical protein